MRQASPIRLRLLQTAVAVQAVFAKGQFCPMIFLGISRFGGAWILFLHRFLLSAKGSLAPSDVLRRMALRIGLPIVTVGACAFYFNRF